MEKLKTYKVLDSIMESIAENWIDHKIDYDDELEWDGDVTGVKDGWKASVLDELNSLSNDNLLDEFINNEDNYWIMTQDFFESFASKVDKKITLEELYEINYEGLFGTEFMSNDGKFLFKSKGKTIDAKYKNFYVLSTNFWCESDEVVVDASLAEWNAAKESEVDHEMENN